MKKQMLVGMYDPNPPKSTQTLTTTRKNSRSAPAKSRTPKRSNVRKGVFTVNNETDPCVDPDGNLDFGGVDGEGW